MGTVVKIGLGIFVGGVLLILGCGALIAGGTNFEDKDGTDTALEDAVDAGDEPSRKPQKTRRFSGNGSKNIGTIKVTDDAVLNWTHSESGDLAFFTINDAEFGINVSSDARKGRSALEPGTYKSVDVSGTGDWTITVKGR